MDNDEIVSKNWLTDFLSQVCRISKPRWLIPRLITVVVIYLICMYSFITPFKLATPGKHIGPKSSGKQRIGNLANKTDERNNRFTVKPSLSPGGLTTRDPAREFSGKVTINWMGRIGNNIFQFASLFCIASMNSLEPFVENGTLFKMFTIKDPVRIDTIKQNATRLVQFGERKSCGYDNRVEKLKKNGFVTRLHGYFQSWRYFNNCDEALRKQLIFKQDLREKASAFLKRIPGNLKKEIVYVGVHVRRGDMINHPYGYRVAEAGYFRRAMDFYRNKFKYVKFIACSDDVHWTKSALKNVSGDVTFVEGSTPERDFAILAHCNHTIMSIGSFGWWAGWLANGEVIYFQTPARPGSKLDKQFTYTDYYPPTWRPMT
ncbi:galactoside alpha-(1,2)-fucosyltransferase 2-like [Lineus longissimus]|uniref:galactoside alpha-(1,2)-fucosyltransferase 2-like n=1 Tax=Lineus longissimus TaxID=88925 RepID=UPI00315D5833